MNVLLAATLRPPLPLIVVAVLVLLAVGGALLLAARHDRRWLIATLRLTALGALGWVLLGPSTTRPNTTADATRPELVLLVDTSGSMAEDDAAAPGAPRNVTRLEALRATWLSDATLARLRAEASVRIVAFDEQARPAEVEGLSADGRATRLLDAADRYTDRVTVVLSDGHDTAEAEGVGTAAPAIGSAALFAVPVGSSRGAPDVALQAWADSDRLFDGQSTRIRAQVYQRGFGDQRARVELTLDGEVVAAEEVTLDRALQTVNFEVQPELAPRRPTQVHGYACRVNVLAEDESYTGNNREDVFIQVTREKTRILLLEGDPYWDTRSLARLVGSHPDYDLTAVFALGDGRQVVTRGADSPMTGDLDAEALARFDVVVLGREVQRVVDAETAAALVPFVQDGGGAVVFARGEAFSGQSAVAGAGRQASEAISPVGFGQREAASLRLAVSEAARGNPLTDLGGDAVVSRLPGMLAATRVDGRRSASVVLLERSGGDAPSAGVATLRVGRGVTMAVLADGLWRWELLRRDLDGFDSVYAVFWTRALQWLASGGEFLPGQDVSLSLDRLSAGVGEPVTLRADTRFADQRGFDPAVRIIAPDRTETMMDALQPGAAGGVQGAVTPDQLGIYRVELTTPGRDDLVDPAYLLTARFAVVDRSPELRDTTARPETLQQLAEQRGGRCLELDEVQPVIDHLRELRATRSADPSTAYRFATWPAFMLIFGGLGLEWFLRRKGGLL